LHNQCSDSCFITLFFILMISFRLCLGTLVDFFEKKIPIYLRVGVDGLTVDEREEALEI